jgi:hypothetical protein
MNRKLIATLTAIATFTLIRKLTGFSGTNVKLPGIPVIRKGIRKLSDEKQPKFTIGDYVQIHGILTVYKIDKVDIRDAVNVYHLEGFGEIWHTEEVLVLASKKEVESDDSPGEYIIRLFDVGDTVQIDGTPEVYRVIGAFPEMIYALEDLATNEIIDMDECVIKPFDTDGNFDITNKGAVEVAKEPKEERKLSAREESSREAERRKQARKQKAADIDNLLDIANWNRKQYEATGDEAFAEKEREQYAKITEITEGAKTNE